MSFNVAQHNGTAVQSLASEHLQEIENLASPEREEQERVVKYTLASMFTGELSELYQRIHVMLNLKSFVSWLGHSSSRHYTDDIFIDTY